MTRNEAIEEVKTWDKYWAQCGESNCFSNMCARYRSEMLFCLENIDESVLKGIIDLLDFDYKNHC